MTYNATALSKCADPLCWFKEVNTQSTISGIEIASTMIVITSFLLSYLLTSRYNSEDSLIASAFFTFVVSVFLATAQLLNPVVVVMTLILFGASVVMK